MAIASTPKRLASGQLPNTKGTLYTAPVNTNTSLIVLLFNTNTSGTPEAVTLYVNDGTSRVFDQPSMPTVTSHTSVCTITINAGDLIEGFTTTAAKVNYFIMGVEKTLS